MRNITLISTRHDEKGLCDASSLHQILESARPEVIFLEVPPSFFDQYFKEKDRSNLESKAVNRYLEAHSADLVPVDVYEVPEDFWVDTERLYSKVEKLSPEYRMLVDRNSQYVERYGFAYLNSKYNVDLWSDINQAIKLAVENAAAEELLNVYERWKGVIEHREREMMKNIHSYSKGHEFESGVFLVGAAHRGSIIEKSEELSFRSSVTLSWNFENYEGLI